MKMRLWWGTVDSAFYVNTEFGVRRSVSASVFGRNLAPIVVKMFSHLIQLKEKFYKRCTFNMICTDNTPINCITVGTKNNFGQL
jgi:hypothetical protein